MYTLLCHSGMALASIATLTFLVAAIGGLGLIVISALRRAGRPA